PPVPPVAMLSVLPVKSGPALAGGVVPPDVARGAWQAAPTSSAAIATDRMRELFISTLLAAGGMLAAREPPFASDLGLCHPPPLSSLGRMSAPPWTLPQGFASLGSIVLLKTVCDAATGFGVSLIGRPSKRPARWPMPRGAPGTRSPSPSASTRSARGTPRPPH